MNITIAGVGAMGSRFALMLHRAGHKVTLVDGWEEHVTAIYKSYAARTDVSRYSTFDT